MIWVGLPKSVTMSYSALSTVKTHNVPRAPTNPIAAIDASLRTLDPLSETATHSRRPFGKPTPGCPLAVLTLSGGHPQFERSPWSLDQNLGLDKPSLGSLMRTGSATDGGRDVAPRRLRLRASSLRAL